MAVTIPLCATDQRPPKMVPTTIVTTVRASVRLRAADNEASEPDIPEAPHTRPAFGAPDG